MNLTSDFERRAMVYLNLKGVPIKEQLLILGLTRSALSGNTLAATLLFKMAGYYDDGKTGTGKQ